MRLALLTTILAGLMFPLTACRSSGPNSPIPNPPAEQQHNQQTLIASRASNEATLPPSTPASHTPDDHRPVLVCFGDSLTAGLGTDPGQSYPDYLQKDLDKLGYKYHVENLGVSGNTTKDGISRLPDVLALHPVLVVVEFGGNDGLRGLPIGDTRNNLDEIIASLQKSGAKIALAGITLPPDYGPDYIQQFNDNYTQSAHKYHVPMLPFLLQNVYGVPGMMQRDETHATAAGNQIVAKNVLRLIQPMLHK